MILRMLRSCSVCRWYSRAVKTCGIHSASQRRTRLFVGPFAGASAGINPTVVVGASEQVRKDCAHPRCRPREALARHGRHADPEPRREPDWPASDSASLLIEA